MVRHSTPQLEPPSEARAAMFDMVQPMLAAAHKEMSELSKKKQDGILNQLKVRHINRLLARAKDALGEDGSLEFLEVLDEDTLPQNSDAVLVLGQWLAAMAQFKDRHFGYDGLGSHRWFTEENPHPNAAWDDDEGFGQNEEDLEE